MNQEIVITPTLHRPACPAMDTPQQIYILLELIANQATGAQSAQPVNLCLALDCSGSMDGDKLTHVRAAAKRVVARLGAQDMLSIIIFDETADVVAAAAPVTDKNALYQKIDAIHARGGTHMSSGMKAALIELQKGVAAQRVSRMALLTDGQTWEDQPDCLGMADQYRQIGIPLKVYGLGLSDGNNNNWDPAFLEDLAQRSGGEWMAIDTPDKATRLFEENLAEMQSAAASNAQLTIRMVEGVSARAVWRVQPVISLLGAQAVGPHDIQVFLGDIQSGVGQSVLIDALLPARQPGSFRLLQADITCNLPASGLEGQRFSTDIVIPFSADNAQTSPFDPRLMNIIERVIAHKQMTQALDEAHAGGEGSAARATQRLRANATRLLNLGEAELANQAISQALQLEQSGAMDPGVIQQMRAQTQKLTHLAVPSQYEGIQPEPDIEHKESQP